MGKAKLSRLAVLVAVLGLVFVGSAVAYKLPKPPGSPGGPPTPPKPTNGQPQDPSTKNAATALGTKLAGYTAAELASKGTFTIKVHFPAAGTFLAKITGGGHLLGTGFAGRASRGDSPLSVTFTSKGKAFLNSVNGQAVKLTIKLTFVPNNHHKKLQTSTVTITTFP